MELDVIQFHVSQQKKGQRLDLSHPFFAELDPSTYSGRPFLALVEV